MKHAICVIFLTISVVCVAHEDHQLVELATIAENLPTKKGGIDAKTQKILAQFANIVMGFLGIVQDPNNVANVKDRVTEMVGNAVNLVTEAVKKGDLSLDATEEEIEEFSLDVIEKKLINIE